MRKYSAKKRITEMTDREYAVFKKRREAYYIRKRFILSVLITFAMVVFLSMAIKGISSNAANAGSDSKCKYYKTDMLKYDMTLDDLAEVYYDEEFYSSVGEVKKEIMEVNHISQDSAIPGGLILYVPYFADIH
ncbi:MAG: hypothetical protein K5669_02915 [Lachnospiraceae bacterium]|nr:hypothetical protein [Lachnospiraceae bacterium]